MVKVLQAIHGEFDREVFTIVKEMFEAGAEVRLISPRWPSKGVTIHHAMLTSPLRIMPKAGGGQLTGLQTALRRMQAGKKTPADLGAVEALEKAERAVEAELAQPIVPTTTPKEEPVSASNPRGHAPSNGEASWLNGKTVAAWIGELEAKADLYDEATKELEELKAKLRAAQEEVIEVKKQVAEDKKEIEAWYASMSRIGQRFGGRTES